MVRSYPAASTNVTSYPTSQRAGVLFEPLGGGQDDWPRLNALMAQLATAAPGTPIDFVPGATYTCSTAGNVWAYTHLRLNGCTINSLLSGGSGGHLTNSVFYCPITNDVAHATTLASNAVVGTNTLSITANTAGIAAGSYMFVVGATKTLNCALYKVLSISGTGPYTVTVDRPVLRAFTSADNVYKSTRFADRIIVEGGNATITGPGGTTVGDRVFELIGGRHCVVSDIKIVDPNGAFADICASWEVGAYASQWLRMEVDGGGVHAQGLAIESAEHCTAVDCDVHDCIDDGILILDGFECYAVRCHSYRNEFGLTVGWGGASVGWGSFRCGAIGGSYDQNNRGNSGTGYGIILDHGTDNQVIGATANYNGGFGVGFAYQTGAYLDDVIADGNGADGINVDVNSVAPRFGVIRARGNKAENFNTYTSCYVDRLIIAEGVAYDLLISAACTVEIGRIEQTNSTSAAVYCLYMPTAGTRLILGGGSINVNCGDNSIGILNTNGVVEIVGSLTLTAKASTLGYVSQNASSLRRSRGRLTTAGAGTGITLQGTSRDSIGTVTLNGTTGVDYGFPDIVATDQIRLTRKTAGSTQGSKAPTFAITGGSKVTVTGDAVSVNDVYEIAIG